MPALRADSATGCANNFRRCRGRLAALGSDSAYDHEILHTYSLPGIIMRGCHALISALSGVGEPCRPCARPHRSPLGRAARRPRRRPACCPYRRIWRTGARAQWPLKWPSPAGRCPGWLGQPSRGRCRQRAASVRSVHGYLVCSRRGFHPGWPGRSSMAQTQEVGGVGWRDPAARPCACGGGRRASVPA
jgi:hypothetical protein